MAPAVLNSFYSLYLKQNTNVGNTITVTNKPLPKKANEQVINNIHVHVHVSCSNLVSLIKIK